MAIASAFTIAPASPLAAGKPGLLLRHGALSIALSHARTATFVREPMLRERCRAPAALRTQTLIAVSVRTVS
jgi:hypothetical protein